MTAPWTLLVILKWAVTIVGYCAVAAIVVAGSIVLTMLAGDLLARWPSPSWARGPRTDPSQRERHP